MNEIMYEVWAKLDTNNCIERIESTAFFTKEKLEELGMIKIDEGTDGKIYGHAQPNYLKMKYGKSMFDDENKCNYKYIDKVIELTDKEKETFFPPIEQQPTEQEQFNAMILIELAKIKAGV